MNVSTDPYRFNSVLMEVLFEQQANILAMWDSQLKPYTAIIKDKVLPETGRRLGFTPHPYEYYSLDCIYITEYDTEHFGPNSGYPKSFSVIIEHENVVSRSCEELSKLLLFNAPLKVLVSYTRDELEIQRYLSRYTKMIEGNGKADIAVNSQRILVVFGGKPETVPVWRSYLYERNGFVEIKLG